MIKPPNRMQRAFFCGVACASDREFEPITPSPMVRNSIVSRSIPGAPVELPFFPLLRLSRLANGLFFFFFEVCRPSRIHEHWHSPHRGQSGLVIGRRENRYNFEERHKGNDIRVQGLFRVRRFREENEGETFSDVLPCAHGITCVRVSKA